MPKDRNGGSQRSVKFYNKEIQGKGDGVIEMELPGKLNLLHPDKDPPAGLEKSSSTGNFCSNRTSVNIQWKNISLATKKGESILNDVSGSVCSGELTAIMGPSGAGKTSLLNVLSGFTRHKVTGQILVNGMNRDMCVFEKLSSYILQDDHILPRLTVREIVSIAASLKIPSTVSKRERQKAVDNCLKCLGLVNQRNQKADELSGGQRKRLCIAQELVSNPPLIFLDEPTSGLDSSSCLQCIQLLKSLAEEGRTVVCTVHQPSSKTFEIFDKLYMLADGKCIYRGTIRNLVPFLSRQGLHCPQYHSPADFVIEVAVGDYGDWNPKLKTAIDAEDIVDEKPPDVDLRGSKSVQDLNLQASTVSLIHKESTDNLSGNKQEDRDESYNGYATSYFNQFKVLFFRNVLCTVREPTNIQLKFLGNSFFSALLGLMYYGVGNDATKVYNNTVLLFCTVTFLIVCAEIPTILTFPMKRIIYERELMNSWYSTGMYYLATIAAEFPFQLLYPIISTNIVYWMSGQPSEMFRFSLFLLTTIIVTLVSESIGQLIGAGTDVQNGIFLAALASIHTTLFCGFFIAFSNMPVYLQWLSYSSFGRYAFQSVMLITYGMDRTPLYCNKTVCPYEDPTVILKEHEMEGDLNVAYSIMLGYLLFFRIVTYLILKYRVMRIH